MSEEPDPEDDRGAEALRVARLWFLQRAGFPDLEARMLADTLDVDWHEAERLLSLRCPPHLIVEILL